MKTGIRIIVVASAIALLPLVGAAQEGAPGALKLHSIFSSHMVLQREKPITVWGWAKPAETVTVTLGEEAAKAVVDETGRWQVVFPAREADGTPQALDVVAGDERVTMDDIVVGDVWVMNGQSNMAFGLGKVLSGDMEMLQANLPLVRRFGIRPNEQRELQVDIPAEKIEGEGWTVSTPATARAFSAIGYVFGSRLHRALGVPIGIIDNARGGASIESLVPRHKFDDDPVAKRYADSVEKRIAAFDPEATAQEKWERQIARMKNKGVPKEKWPEKAGPESLRSWDIPGMSPSDMGSCYNGMFGAFKGLNIKGVLFHQGFNNTMGSNCRPKRYRVLMRLMVEGWREDFRDPALPVAVIGFCAGGIVQTEDNFEQWLIGGGPYIREAQRLGLADLGDPERTAFLPAYDIKIPGLHPLKKQAHGLRAARWALNRVYGQRVNWDQAKVLSAEPEGDRVVLTFDKSVMPDDLSIIPRGFAIADDSGEFVMVHARFKLTKDAGIWSSARKNYDTTQIYVWSPLVEEPVAVRYGWASSPMGNLKVSGKPWLPMYSFRTDSWDYPESDDPTVKAMSREQGRTNVVNATARCADRRAGEARLAVTVLERLETLGRNLDVTEN